MPHKSRVREEMREDEEVWLSEAANAAAEFLDTRDAWPPWMLGVCADALTGTRLPISFSLVQLHMDERPAYGVFDTPTGKRYRITITEEPK